MSTVVIAEAGVNHNGRTDLALALVDAAADAGADIVKFQTFRAEELTTRDAGQAAYQIRNLGREETQYEMLKGLELDAEAHRRIFARCTERGVAFLSTPFDLTSLRLLVDGMKLPRLKVGSGDLTNAPLLLEIARAGRQVILSTGMATLGEIDEALGVLAFGYCGGTNPSRPAFRSAIERPDCRAALDGKVVLLHCTSEYPAPDDEINLCAMDTLAQRYQLPVGLSDHSVGTAVSVAAVARGAVMIEKHLTLDRSMAGPDHAASIEPGEFKTMMSAIRQVERALGPGGKAPTPSERKTTPVARKSIVAREPIFRGEPLNAANLAVKRPGNGLSPAVLWDLLGRRASRDYAANELIDVTELDNEHS